MIAELIEHPRAEVYTRAGLREMQGKYYSADDVGAVEAGLGGPPR